MPDESALLQAVVEAGYLHGNALPDFREDIGTDYDGSMMGIRPSQSLFEFEKKHGRREWLHSAERHGRTVYREEF